MKKSPSKKKNVPAKRNFWSFNKQNRSERLAAVALVLIVVIVVGVGAWLLSRHVAMNHEKHDFATAQADTRTIASAIEAAVGKPSDSLTYGECFKADQNLIYNGSLNCVVGSVLVYSVADPIQAQTTANASSSVLQKSDFITHIEGSPKQFGSSNTNVVNRYTTEYVDTRANSLLCSINYNYLDSSGQIKQFSTVLNSNGPHTLLVDVSCSHSAMSTYYPTIQLRS